MEAFAYDDYIKYATLTSPTPFMSTSLWHLLLENYSKHDVMCHIPVLSSRMNILSISQIC